MPVTSPHPSVCGGESVCVIRPSLTAILKYTCELIRASLQPHLTLVQGTQSQSQSVQDKLAEAKARVSKLTASWSQPNQSKAAQPSQPASQPPKNDLNASIAKSRAEIARKTQEMKERTQSRINPHLDANRTDIKAPGSGLGTTSHPLLASIGGTSSPASTKPAAPKFTSVKVRHFGVM